METVAKVVLVIALCGVACYGLMYALLWAIFRFVTIEVTKGINMNIIEIVRCLVVYVNARNRYDVHYGHQSENGIYSMDCDEFRRDLYRKFRNWYNHKNAEKMTDSVLTIFMNNGGIKHDSIRNKYVMKVKHYYN